MTSDIFVGRVQELDRLCEAFDGAREGRGGLVMITGEPGIGKTRLARKLESYAAEVARFIPELSGSPKWTSSLRCGRPPKGDALVSLWRVATGGVNALQIDGWRNRGL